MTLKLSYLKNLLLVILLMFIGVLPFDAGGQTIGKLNWKKGDSVVVILKAGETLEGDFQGKGRQYLMNAVKSELIKKYKVYSGKQVDNVIDGVLNDDTRKECTEDDCYKAIRMAFSTDHIINIGLSKLSEITLIDINAFDLRLERVQVGNKKETIVKKEEAVAYSGDCRGCDITGIRSLLRGYMYTMLTGEEPPTPKPTPTPTPKTAPKPDYEELADGYRELADGSIWDKSTGLIWMATDDGSEMNQRKAVSFCKNLTAHGKSDWRLPGKDELETLLTQKKTNELYASPVLNLTKFSSGWSLYWSSLIYASDSSRAWGVNFSSGNAYWLNRTHGRHVRCVRSGN